MEKKWPCFFAMLLVFSSGFSQMPAKGYPEAKLTVCVVDSEGGEGIPEAFVGIGWLRQATQNPWDGQAEIKATGLTNTNGCFTSSEFAFRNVAFSATVDGYYSSTGAYEYKTVSNGQWQPWNPVETLRLKKMKKPIPMYAKSYHELGIPVTGLSYDLIKGDFLPPHGKGESEDCIFQISMSEEGEFGEIGHSRTTGYTITFLGDFNGWLEIPPEEIISECFFVWPYDAPDADYTKKEIRYARTRGLHLNPQDPRPEAVPLTKKEVASDPVGEHIFFRIRSEKNPDGSFKSALYGKMIRPKEIEFNRDRRTGKETFALKYFSFYVNPTRNDRNMEFDRDENLIYADKKTYIPIMNKWRVTADNYKNGEFEVTRP